MSNHRALKFVLQEDASGCGIACIAIVARKTYKSIKAIMIKNKIFLSTQKRGFYTRHDVLKVTLRKLGLRTENFRRIGNWKKTLPTAIVRVKMGQKKDIWHWVVYDSSKHHVLDPLKGIVPTSKYRRKLVSYMKVWVHN